MATIYVRGTAGSNANSGNDWNTAKQSVAGAIAKPIASGDVVVVDNTESFVPNAAVTWTFPAGSFAVYSALRSGTTGWTPAYGASESAGTASAGILISGSGGTSSIHVYGMLLIAGTGVAVSSTVGLLSASTAISQFLSMENCTLQVPVANTAGVLVCGISATNASRSSTIVLKDCTLWISGSRAGEAVSAGDVNLEMIDQTFTFSGASKPASVFRSSNVADTPNIVLRDTNITTAGVSTASLLNVANWTTGSMLCKNCSLPSTLTTGAYPGGIGSLTLRNCVSGGTPVPYSRRDMYGTMRAVTDAYVADGAEFEAAPVSWEVITTASCSELFPFVASLIESWAPLPAGAKTVEVEVLSNSATNYTDRQVWSDLEYPGGTAASDAVYLSASTRNPMPLAGTANNLADSSASWTYPGGVTNPNPQKLVHNITTVDEGLAQLRVNVGVPGVTLYINPVLSGL